MFRSLSLLRKAHKNKNKELKSKKPTFHNMDIHHFQFIPTSNAWIAYEKEQKVKKSIRKQMNLGESLDQFVASKADPFNPDPHEIDRAVSALIKKLNAYMVAVHKKYPTVYSELLNINKTAYKEKRNNEKLLLPVDSLRKVMVESVNDLLGVQSNDHTRIKEIYNENIRSISTELELVKRFGTEEEKVLAKPVLDFYSEYMIGLTALNNYHRKTNGGKEILLMKALVRRTYEICWYSGLFPPREEDPRAEELHKMQSLSNNSLRGLYKDCEREGLFNPPRRDAPKPHLEANMKSIDLSNGNRRVITDKKVYWC